MAGAFCINLSVLTMFASIKTIIAFPTSGVKNVAYHLDAFRHAVRSSAGLAEMVSPNRTFSIKTENTFAELVSLSGGYLKALTVMYKSYNGPLVPLDVLINPRHVSAIREKTGNPAIEFFDGIDAWESSLSYADTVALLQGSATGAILPGLNGWVEGTTPGFFTVVNAGVMLRSVVVERASGQNFSLGTSAGASDILSVDAADWMSGYYSADIPRYFLNGGTVHVSGLSGTFKVKLKFE